MAKTLFTVVASVNTALYNDLRVGDIVTCCPSDNNKADIDAVDIFLGPTHVGYAANSKETVLAGTVSASRFKRLVESPRVAKTSAVLRKEEDFTNKSGLKQRRFLAEAFFVPARNAAKDSSNAIRATVGGTGTHHCGKAQFMGELSALAKSGAPINIPVEVCRIKMASKEMYLLVRKGEQDAGESIGEVTSDEKAIAPLFDGCDRIPATVVEYTNRNSYVIEIVPGTKPADEYYPYIDAAIERCVAQSPELEARLDIMRTERFPDSTIKRVFEQMPTLDAARAQIPYPAQFYHQKSGYNLSDAVSYMLRGKTVQLVGEKGSGKNTLVETACWLLGRPMTRIQGSTELDKLDIFGAPSLKDGNTGFELSTLLETLRDDGIVVVDEANTIMPSVMVQLHSLTDNARSVNVPGYGPVQMGPHACLVYTMNEDYVGTSEMNAATIDRGPRLFIEQEADLTALLKAAAPSASDSDISICVKVSEQIKKSIKESGELTKDAATIRGYIDALQNADIPLKRALIQNVANKAQSESERTAMKTIIESFCR